MCITLYYWLKRTKAKRIIIKDFMKSLLNIEEHPLEPFLPVNAKLLMLGSFPPQKKRWSMEFFYPNLQNDMWRIFGIIFFQNKDHFLNPDKKYLTRNVLLIF